MRINEQINAILTTRFGSGKKILVMLPGLGDGLQTVKGTALPMAVMYRQFAKEYKDAKNFNQRVLDFLA